MWTHRSFFHRPHFIEIDEHNQISYNGQIFHGKAEYQPHPIKPLHRIILQFSPKHDSVFLRLFVFIHISGTANYLYDNNDNYTCILTRLNNEDFVFSTSDPSVPVCIQTTYRMNNRPTKRSRMTFTTDEEEEELMFKDFQKAQDDFQEPSPTAVKKAIALTRAHLKDHILRSSLCRQPEGRDRADQIIAEEVMSVAAIEQKAAEVQERVLVSNSPLDREPSSSSDLN